MIFVLEFVSMCLYRCVCIFFFSNLEFRRPTLLLKMIARDSRDIIVVFPQISTPLTSKLYINTLIFLTSH